MNIQTADECRTRFDELKFRKIDARYIVYQIVNEKIVTLSLKKRSLKELVKKNKTGNNSSTHFLIKNIVTASMI